VILVDSSLWIDYFRGTMSPQASKLNLLLGAELIGIGDLILTKVLQAPSDLSWRWLRRRADTSVRPYVVIFGDWF